MPNPIQILWARHHPPGGRYPEGVLAVPEPIMGRAFFPAGYGLVGVRPDRPLPAVPAGGVMVLGHDLNSEAGYRKAFRAGGESETMPTWKNLLELLREVPIVPERCFFTNFYMGLRKGTKTTGEFPGATDPPFVEHCKVFFLEQLKMQRPSLILTLGMHVPPLLAGMSADLSGWGKQRRIENLNDAAALRRNVRFPDLPDYETTVAALIQPHLRSGSLQYRRYKDSSGHAAELLLLRDAVSASAHAT